MRHRPVLSVVATAVACSITGAAPASPERDAVIRIGKGIGKIQLGMTLPAVRRVLRRPHAVVYRRADFGRRGRYLELGWELPGRTSWEPALWHVGFRSTSRRGPLRVTRVGTDARSQRTPKGLGIGSRSRDVAKAYPDATCVTRFGGPHPGFWIVVESPGGGMTAFQADDKSQGFARTTYFVIEVMVQRAWYSKGTGHDNCPRGWEDW